MISCSVGIMAYNEEVNIGLALESLLNQRLANVNIEEICIVASGCTDNTLHVISSFAGKCEKIKLLIQNKREGKMSAINLYLQTTKSSIVSIINADLILKEDVIEKLISPFFDSRIGMAGGRVIPLDKPDNFMGFAAHFLWELHHRVALKFPKLGEMVAYRRLDNLQFPLDTVDDEGIAEAIMTQRGLKLSYVPEAVFNNLNPQRVTEFIRRRRNIYAGHLQLKNRMSYVVSTVNIAHLFRVLPCSILKIMGFNLRLILWTVMIIAIEIWARALGAYDFYIAKKDHSVWEIAKTSRRRPY